jgi:hypothetical protein
MSHPALAASRRAVDYTRLLVRDHRRLTRENMALRARVAELERHPSQPDSSVRNGTGLGYVCEATKEQR